jgi:hypothetical protein
MDLLTNVQQTVDDVNRATALAKWYAFGSLVLLVFIAVKVREQ